MINGEPIATPVYKWIYKGKQNAYLGEQQAEAGAVVEHDCIVFDPKNNSCGCQFQLVKVEGGMLVGSAVDKNGKQFEFTKTSGHIFVPRSGVAYTRKPSRRAAAAAAPPATKKRRTTRAVGLSKPTGRKSKNKSKTVIPPDRKKSKCKRQ